MTYRDCQHTINFPRVSRTVEENWPKNQREWRSKRIKEVTASQMFFTSSNGLQNYSRLSSAMPVERCAPQALAYWFRVRHNVGLLEDHAIFKSEIRCFGSAHCSQPGPNTFRLRTMIESVRQPPIIESNVAP